MNKIIKKGLLGIVLTCGSVVLVENCFSANFAEQAMMEIFMYDGKDYKTASVAMDFGEFRNRSVFTLADDHGKAEFAGSFNPGDRDGFVKDLIEECVGQDYERANDNAANVYVNIEKIPVLLEEIASKNIIKLIKESVYWDEAIDAYVRSLNLSSDSKHIRSGFRFWDQNRFQVDDNGRVSAWGVDLRVTLTSENVFDGALEYISQELRGASVHGDLNVYKLFKTMCGRNADGMVKFSVNLQNVKGKHGNIDGTKFEVREVSRKVIDMVNAAIDAKK